jgi:hypothetical protein
MTSPVTFGRRGLRTPWFMLGAMFGPFPRLGHGAGLGSRGGAPCALRAALQAQRSSIRASGASHDPGGVSRDRLDSQHCTGFATGCVRCPLSGSCFTVHRGSRAREPRSCRRGVGGVRGVSSPPSLAAALATSSTPTNLRLPSSTIELTKSGTTGPVGTARERAVPRRRSIHRRGHWLRALYRIHDGHAGHGEPRRAAPPAVMKRFRTRRPDVQGRSARPGAPYR